MKLYVKTSGQKEPVIDLEDGSGSVYSSEKITA